MYRFDICLGADEKTVNKRQLKAIVRGLISKKALRDRGKTLYSKKTHTIVSNKGKTLYTIKDGQKERYTIRLSKEFRKLSFEQITKTHLNKETNREFKKVLAKYD